MPPTSATPRMPPSTACTTACGATYAYAATMFSRYATADILYFVGCQQSMRTWVDGPGLQSNLQMHSLDTSTVADLPSHCGPFVTVDAGIRRRHRRRRRGGRGVWVHRRVDTPYLGAAAACWLRCVGEPPNASSEPLSIGRK